MTTNETSLGVNFFEEFFIKPIIERTGYNIINTITYGILLIIGAYVLFKFFKKLKLRIDFKLFIINLPFILLVAVWRSLTDAGVYPYHFLTTTPGLYVPVLLLFFSLTLLAVRLDRKYKIPYWKVFAGVSTALLITQLTLIRVKMPEAISLYLFFALITTAPFIVLKRWIKPLRNNFNLSIFIAHMLDATATHVSITYYGYFEQHVIPNLFIWLFGGSTWGFYALKLLVLIPIIYFLDANKGRKSARQEELINWVKIVFIVYGIATGMRGLLRLIMSA